MAINRNTKQFLALPHIFFLPILQILQTQAKDHYEMCKTQFTALPPSS